MLRGYGLVIRDDKEQLCKCCRQLRIKIQNFHQDLLGQNIIRRNQKITKEQFFFFLGKALSGHVISVHQASTEIACTHKCLSDPKCASFNFEIQQSRSLFTCELNAVSRTSPYNELKSRDGFAYYEPVTPRERPKQQITTFSQTSNLITEAATTQGTQAVSPTQDEATTPASRVPSTHSEITPGPGKWFTKSKGTHSLLGN